MNRLASPAQLRASLIRWALFIVPTIMLLGFLSGEASGSGAENPWFMALDKPAIYPPPIVFPIVWAFLYLLMGLSLAGVCSAWGSRSRPLALAVFAVQFGLNLAWSPVFFAMHQIDVALAIIVLLDVALIATIVLFVRVRQWAGLLLLPYLAWVLFATLLNWQFLELNPDAASLEAESSSQRIEL